MLPITHASTAPQDAGRPAPLRARLLRWLAGLLVCFGGAELIARHYISGSLDIVRPSDDAELLFELRPGHYLSDGYFTKSPEVAYTVDERGCRQVEPERRAAYGEAAPGGTPVFFLGSSIVFGIASPSDETLPEVAARTLAARSPPVAIVPRNCSVPGYSLLQTLRHGELAMERDGERVLAMVVAPRHGMVPYDWTQMAPSSPAMRFLTQHVRLARLAHLLRVIREANEFRLPNVPPSQLGAALDRFAEVARRTGTRTAFFVVGRFEHPEFNIVAELRARGLAVVEVEPPTRSPAYVHVDGDHWNLAGVQWLVERMTPGLVALVDPGAASVEAPTPSP